MSLGLDPAMYWELSPREGEIIVGGVLSRIRREHNERMTAAYWAGVIPVSKKPPKLSDLLVDVEEEPTAKDWRQLKAALLWAMPPKGNG